MRKNWLRGILLGVSLALLLASGVALAQDGLFNWFNKDCVECWAGDEKPTLDRYFVEWTAGGWNPLYELCVEIAIDGAVMVPPSCSPPPEVDQVVQDIWLPCEWGDNVVAPASALGREVNVDNAAPGPLGEWAFRLWQRDAGGVVIDSATASFLLAETCEAEFVPEPGTMMLLSSGLAGLAGYATLRWRTRK